MIVRTTAQPEKFIATIKGSVWTIDKDRPIFSIHTVETLLSEARAEPRFYLLLFGVFAGATLVLAALGIYGVMAYLVSLRRHEIGIRLALGAQIRDISRLMIGQGLRLTALGLSGGVLVALAPAGWLKSLFYDQRTTDPLTPALMALLLAGVALPACWIPVRRRLTR